MVEFLVGVLVGALVGALGVGALVRALVGAPAVQMAVLEVLASGVVRGISGIERKWGTFYLQPMGCLV